MGENGERCPQVRFAPQTPIEHRVWTTAAGDGCWRLERIEEKEGEEHFTRLRPKGIDMAEALVRLGPASAEERDAFVDLLTAIEMGALQGARTQSPVDPPDTTRGG